MEVLGYLPKIIAILAAAVVLVAVFRKLNLSPVLGYLVAGAAIGQHGIGFIDSHDLHVLAEFGVVFLLFAIGLELTMERLMAMRSHVFGFGSLQVAITATVIAYLAYLMGQPLQAAVVIGGALSLSSTAIVLRVLSDSKMHTTQVGRLSLATLLLQDFAVVPLLVLVPVLAVTTDHTLLASAISGALGKAVLAMIAIFVGGRLLLRPLFNMIASTNSNELFIATTLLLVLGSSYLSYIWGGGSLAMGAFIAGLLVAETQYQHQVEETIMPFKDLLMGLFFTTVGMNIDLALMYDHLLLLIGLSLGLLLIKAGLIVSLCRLFRFPWGSSIHAGLTLAQAGEFAFVLFGLAAQDHIQLISPVISQILLMVVTITMALTPALFLLGRAIARRFDQDGKVEAPDAPPCDLEDLNRHVIVAGFGRVGEMVAKLLSAKRINYVIVEGDARRVSESRKQGFPIYHGDPTKIETLEAVGLKRSKTVIVSLANNTLVKRCIRTVHKHYKDVPIVARTPDLKNAKTLTTLGATLVVPEQQEAGLQLAGELLSAVGMSELEVSQLKNEFRAKNYDIPLNDGS